VRYLRLHSNDLEDCVGDPDAEHEVTVPLLPGLDPGDDIVIIVEEESPPGQMRLHGTVTRVDFGTEHYAPQAFVKIVSADGDQLARRHRVIDSGRRKESRHQLSRLVDIQVSATGQRGVGVIKNASRHGAYIATSLRIELHETIQIRFMDKATRRSFFITTHVSRISRAPSRGAGVSTCDDFDILAAVSFQRRELPPH
jgi:hypothetical protein